MLYTDGVSESMNAQDDEWGEERLIDCAKTCGQLSARESLDRMMSEAAAFAAGAPQHDDMTLVVMRFAPDPQFQNYASGDRSEASFSSCWR